MKHSHTPGPWRVKRGTYFPETGGDIQEYFWVGVENIGDEIPVLSKSWSKEQQEANARLIGAAPELLTWAQDLVGRLTASERIFGELDAYTQNSVNTLQAVIRKATGGAE